MSIPKQRLDVIEKVIDYINDNLTLDEIKYLNGKVGKRDIIFNEEDDFCIDFGKYTGNLLSDMTDDDQIGWLTWSIQAGVWNNRDVDVDVIHGYLNAVTCDPNKDTEDEPNYTVTEEEKGYIFGDNKRNFETEDATLPF